MKAKTIISVIAGIALLFQSCEVNTFKVNPSGNVITETESFTGYTELDVSHAFNVEVRFSDSQESIEIEADDNLFQYILVDMFQDILRIRIKDNVNIKGQPTLNAFITTSPLEGFSGSGATTFDLIDSLEMTIIRITLSGASSFSGTVGANTLQLFSSGASNVDLQGEANTFEIEASGASIIKDFGFEVNHLDADLSGASIIRLTINETIDITASGASFLYYQGDATVNNASLSGASQIIKSK